VAFKEAFAVLKSNPRGALAISNYVAGIFYNFATNPITD
jgi:hypothetical protein